MLSQLESGSTGFRAISDLTDVGISSALLLALAFSVIPMLRPLTRPALRDKVCPVTRPGGVSSVSVFCKVHRVI